MTVASSTALAQQLTGELGAHDPSTLIKAGTTYYYYATGQGLASRTSTDRVSWKAGPSVFASTPAWVTAAVPGFTGFFWAPDVIYRNNQYYLYYAASIFGTKTSVIGLATSPTLDPSAANYAWTDQGMVVQSNGGSNYNAIDPSIFQDSGTGRLWMSYGSFNAGIFVRELDSTTGKFKSGSSAVNVAAPGPTPEIEGSALIEHGGYYYLAVDWGGCCAGVDSTYNLRVGRSASPTGPFLDKTGQNMLSGGGTLLVDDDGNRTGPGHFSLFSEAGQDYFGYHYYNGDAAGAPTYGLHKLYWTADAWPSYAPVAPNWIGTTNSNWSSSTNWTSEGVPNGAGHVANFVSNSSNRYTVTLDGAGKTVASVSFRGTASYTIGATNGFMLTLDSTDGNPATINVAEGNHAIAAPIVALDPLGINVTPIDKTLTLSGSVSGSSFTKYGRGTLALTGANTYTGTMLLRYGTLDISAGSVSAGNYTSIAPIVSESATIILRGNGNFTANADFNVGDTGDANTPATGTLELRDNASLTVNTAGGFFVGSGFFANTRAVGTVNQTGGTLTAGGNFDGAFIIGGRGSSLAVGTYNLSAGTVNANTNVRVGGLGNGTVNQTGGVFNSPSYLSIGRFAGATGVWNLSSGTLNQSNAARLLIVGESGSGTLTVSGSGQVSLSGSLRLGYANGGAGIVNLDGGSISTPFVARGPGTGTFNFNGGTLRATASSTTFMQGLTAANVKAGGAVIDTNGVAVSLSQLLAHDPALGSTVDGGLTKTGAGALTLTSNETYTGSTHVAQGTLVFGATQSQGRPLLIDAGATARVAAGGNKVLVTTSLTLPTGGLLDLTDNAMIYAYGASPTPAGSVRQMLADGRLGSGLATAGRGIGFAEMGPLGLTSWNGVTSPTGTSALLLRYTLLGDTNLDGTVNFVDLLRLAQNYGSTSPTADWSAGDFNYDGTSNFTDLLALAQNYGQTMSVAPVGDWDASVRLVPEPATWVVAMSFAASLRRPKRASRQNAAEV